MDQTYAQLFDNARKDRFRSQRPQIHLISTTTGWTPHFEFEAFFEPDCTAHAVRIASQMRVKPEVKNFWILRNNANSSHNASCWWPHHYHQLHPRWAHQPCKLKPAPSEAVNQNLPAPTLACSRLSESMQDQHPRTRTMASAVWMCAKGRSQESLEKDYDMPRYAFCAGSFHQCFCISAILDNEGSLIATNQFQ